jgi:hypothetical protein
MKVKVTKNHIFAINQRIDLVRAFGLMDKKDDSYRKKFIAQIQKLKELLNRLLAHAGN